MKTYFKAFKYLTVLAGEALPSDDLAKMPPRSKSQSALLDSRLQFLHRSFEVSRVLGRQKQAAPLCKTPAREVRLFPLSWGLDNEILLSTVFHPDWPESEQVKGRSGPRLISSASGYRIGAGQRFATSLLATEIEKYPSLAKNAGNPSDAIG